MFNAGESFTEQGEPGKQEVGAIFLQDVFYNKVMADDRLNHFFEGIDMKAQRVHQVCDTSHFFIITLTASS